MNRPEGWESEVDRDRAWPAYLRALRPDEVTVQRLRRRVLGAADALLEARSRSWHEVAAGWSSILAPLAAGLLLAFGALAYRASSDASVTAAETMPEPAGLIPSLAPDAERLPAMLIDAAEPSRDAVLTAVLVAR